MSNSERRQMIRAVLVTNQPTPYRSPVFDLVGSAQGFEFVVIYCTEREADRAWNMPARSHQSVILPGWQLNLFGKFIHINPSVLSELRRLRPDIVITTGFNPTHLLAFAYCAVARVRHVAMTDGSLKSEAKLSWLHRLIRRWVFPRTSAFISASEGGKQLYQSYGVPKDKIFRSCLCIDNRQYAIHRSERLHDLVFAGRFVDVKQPLFALEVAELVAAQLGREIGLLFIGGGPLEAALRSRAASAKGVATTFAGFIQQANLPAKYASGKVLLVPSRWEPWGLVVNEGCAAGLAVVASSAVGAAHELVDNGINGAILEPEKKRWAAVVADYLSNEDRQLAAEQHSRRKVQDFSFESSARGIEGACRAALQSRRVVIVQRRLTHYRVPFFEGLHRALQKRNISLELVIGEATENEKLRRDGGEIPWAHRVKTVYLGETGYCLQMLPKSLMSADLVICPQENSMLMNHVMLFGAVRRFAFWGHGKNFQSRKRTLGERLKEMEARRSFWWFAYTEMSRRHLNSIGVHDGRITVVNNSLEPPADIVVNRRYGECRSRAVFLGSLHEDKRIGFLISACDQLAERIPEFALTVIGEGPQREVILAAARTRPWLKFEGALTGERKWHALSEADVMLCPGMVGLNVIDAFVAGLPLVTTDNGIHSPEIEYVNNWENGVITENTVQGFVSGVARLFRDPALLAAIQKNALQSASFYSIDCMIANFATGIEECLAQ